MTWENVLQFLINLFSFDEKHPLLFTQFNFWAFFAIVFAVFALLHRKRLLRNTFLFFVSLLFYYKTSGLFVLILLFDTFLDYFLGVFMDKSQRDGWRKTFMISGVVINLLILFYFKYAYFCTDAYNTIVGSELVQKFGNAMYYLSLQDKLGYAEQRNTELMQDFAASLLSFVVRIGNMLLLVSTNPCVYSIWIDLGSRLEGYIFI